MDPTLLFPVLILLLFIPLFLTNRRQKRQMNAMQSLQRSLSPGDVVMTTSGLRGTVTDAAYEETVDLEIAPGVVTTWVRAAIREKINPTVVGEVEHVDLADAADETASDPADDAHSNGATGGRS